jgi:hypothetical protein
MIGRNSPRLKTYHSVRHPAISRIYAEASEMPTFDEKPGRLIGGRIDGRLVRYRRTVRLRSAIVIRARQLDATPRLHRKIAATHNKNS